MKSAPAVLVLIIFVVGIFAVINGTDSTVSGTGDAIKMSKMPVQNILRKYIRVVIHLPVIRLPVIHFLVHMTYANY